MQREHLVLAALSPAKRGAFSPVQVQKLLFLIEENLSDDVGGKCFDFVPYDYGPFDKDVYKVLEDLKEQGNAEIMDTPWHRPREYRLTGQGQGLGDQYLEKIFDKAAQDYVVRLVEFVRSVSFPDLVAAIYREYPDMSINSVFQE